MWVFWGPLPIEELYVYLTQKLFLSKLKVQSDERTRGPRIRNRPFF